MHSRFLRDRLSHFEVKFSVSVPRYFLTLCSNRVVVTSSVAFVDKIHKILFKHAMSKMFINNIL